MKARDVRVTLDKVPVLHGVDLTASAGSWLTVIGPNGSGKSTLLRALAGLVRFDGTVELDGVPVGSLRRRDRARRIALVPQNPVSPPGMAVREYVLLGRTPYVQPLGREGERDLDTVDGVLRLLDLEAFAQRALSTLSGGERQRVFLARALAQGAPVLLLDEPTAALDIGHQQEVLDLVDELRRTRALTVVTTMHDLVIAGEYAERLVLLDAGRVAAQGAPAEVLTERNLARHYHARVRVIDGESGPLVVPIRSVAAAKQPGLR
ncbi:MAG: ABC transporter ATP-binding protein [Micromonosporaceae bacterium]